MPRAVILAQGDELTTGATVDTNSSWLAGRLWGLGVLVRRVVTAPDDQAEIASVLREAEAMADVVVSTGGLGPTSDDWTAAAAATAFDMPLELNALALAQVEARYAAWRRQPTPAARKQAVLPRGCRVLENHWGTAPAFAIDRPGCPFYFLPGVPREMKPLFESAVEPEIRARLGTVPPRLVILRTSGAPESELAERMRGIHEPGLTVGYRASMGEVQIKLRFDADVPEERASEVVSATRAALGAAVYGVDSGDLAEVVGRKLGERGETLAVAESCTAGRLAAFVASVPGASAWLLEGAVVYSNAAKTRAVGVPAALIEAHGAVSEEVARALAEGVRARAASTWGIGVTGIAGPGGGTAEKPVGTVHIAVAGPTGTVARKLALAGDRERIQTLSVAASLTLLLRQMRS